ncbi:MAG: tRNA (guanosine(37)-N1)-methyltransferase TrmD [Helicobacter sp.]|uniref:tRNA (guanosine(37)-N1)-methyltransferase TrmD n=1 Tax=Helicobacter sp. 10-6591 TaxID=2004998 RepID=UPI000DCC97CA|nr:tRNA (guanosine(37)-N1)-methyltransferase TrmD [Helicobacter sp. 10-6591]MCI7484659.1 tRNA (guanosine(37)-N1)-methyltransferase TrmD [Helicobacter sp.]MDD7567776.1 tRNA (guanosine(37)-N1)-methyltransferase TrmD [Helicobacter sp.]MDY5741083.1 tRNA (guanosine(37)-N1)-methyltransferase TrmD [Helicobacter sp.]RAX55943.1 tRNA (guanosine(37)-N1)-methyltransferase TrmD [Helicobacter sp. 10-6591]
MKFNFLTLFPQFLISYFEYSILKRAIAKNLIEVSCIDIREFGISTHLKVDAPPIGGGAGQVLLFEVLQNALEQVKDSHIIFLSPCAKRFCQNDAIRLAKKSHISFVCGRYEGFDERLIECFADEVFSVGDFIMSGGELAALSLSDSIARQIKGVLGNADSLKGESFEFHLLEAPNFAKNSTQTEKILKNFEYLATPSGYSKGNHNKIDALKLDLAIAKTKYFRPDLYLSYKTQQCRLSDSYQGVDYEK